MNLSTEDHHMHSWKKKGMFLLTNKTAKKQQSCTIPGHALWVGAHTYRYFKWKPKRAVCHGCEHTHTVKEETWCAVCHGYGVTHTFLRGGIIFLHTVYRRCGYNGGRQQSAVSSAKGENIAGANSGKSGMSDLEAVSIRSREVSLGVCGKLETVRGKTEKCMWYICSRERLSCTEFFVGLKANGELETEV